MTPLEKIGLIASELVSTLLIINLWRTHKTDKTARKLFWSLILTFPVFGWIFYGGLYSPPSSHDNPKDPPTGGTTVPPFGDGGFVGHH